MVWIEATEIFACTEGESARIYFARGIIFY
jgi:hypothetical protein